MRAQRCDFLVKTFHKKLKPACLAFFQNFACGIENCVKIRSSLCFKRARKENEQIFFEHPPHPRKISRSTPGPNDIFCVIEW